MASTVQKPYFLICTDAAAIVDSAKAVLLDSALTLRLEQTRNNPPKKKNLPFRWAARQEQARKQPRVLENLQKRGAAIMPGKTRGCYYAGKNAGLLLCRDIYFTVALK